MSESAEIELSAAERAILRTVLYSSLFDYPLKLEELHRNLLELALEAPEVLEVYQSSEALQSVIDYEDKYLFPQGRKKLIQKRHQREVRTRQILGAHGWVLKLIASIPYTRVVAISGSAAHLNVDRGGDIDLFIVTRGNRVWSAAVTTLLLTRLLRCRKNVCFNFIVSDRRLVIERKDLFNANQMVHLKPLIGEGMYREFLKVNPFVAKCYPNFRFNEDSVRYRPGRTLQTLKRVMEWITYIGPAQLQELVCRKAYSWYLQRKSHSWTSPQEVVLGKDYLKLHTESHRAAVLQRFEEVYEATLEELRSKQSRDRQRVSQKLRRSDRK